MQLKSKKLLVLGGTNFSCEIIREAQNLGVYVIVTDYLPDSPGKKIADKSFDVSATDIESVVKLIREERIDGVLTGFIEMLLPYYQQICEKSGCFCYANKNQFEIATNKHLFKELCRQFSISVVEEYKVELPLPINNISNLNFPLIVKPTDHSGARGVFICHNYNDLLLNYKRALSFSKSQNLLIEKFYSYDEVTIFYLIQDGDITLSAMADRITKSDNPSQIPLPQSYIFPSKNIDNYEKLVHPKVKEMFKSIGLKNGMLFIQSFIDDNNFYFYEMGYRLSTTFEYKIISEFNKLNPLQMMIRFALTGKMYDQPIKKLINPYYLAIGFNLTLLIKPGIIGKITGLEEIRSNKTVLDAILSYHVGEYVPEDSVDTLKQVILRVIGIAPTKETFTKIIQLINHSFKVYSIKGELMLIRPLDEREILSKL